MSPASAFELAARTFHVVRWGVLTEEHFHHSRDTSLYAKSESAQLGKADAFISHSWSGECFELSPQRLFYYSSSLCLPHVVLVCP